MTKVEKEKRRLTIAASQSEKKVMVTVSDTGCGIIKENLQKIFFHGYSLESNRQGFGLHACANYMTEMGGTMYAASEGEGRGATFTLIFNQGNTE